MKGGGGFLLLLIGAVGLIGYLTGNLPRWIGYLFAPDTLGTGNAGGSIVGILPPANPKLPGAPAGEGPNAAPVPSANQRATGQTA